MYPASYIGGRPGQPTVQEHVPDNSQSRSTSLAAAQTASVLPAYRYREAVRSARGQSTCISRPWTRF